MDEQQRREIALWRYSILGSIVSARLEHGDRKQHFDHAAAREWESLDGRLVRLSARTIEGWYYRWREGGLEGLMPASRSDAGTTHLPSELCDLLIRAKREKPSRSIPQLIKILERAKKVPKGTLSRSTVYRVLARVGLSHRPARTSKERRSFLVEHVGDLWMGDAMHGPRVREPEGLRKSYLLSILDGASRYIVRSAFMLGESAVEHEHVMREALQVHGRPRTYYVDLGAAYVAQSLSLGCAELGIHLLHTAPRDCQAKGAIERWHRTWRAEVGDELPTEPLTLAELNAKHWAWLEVEYHGRRHSTTGRSPREHFLAEAGQHRPLPRGLDLREVFLRRERRKVRADGTVQLFGRTWEVPSHLSGRWVQLRVHATDSTLRPRVYFEGEYLGEATLLDLHRNATRRRRRPRPETTSAIEPTGLDTLADLERVHYREDDQEQD